MVGALCHGSQQHGNTPVKSCMSSHTRLVICSGPSGSGPSSLKGSGSRRGGPRGDRGDDPLTSPRGGASFQRVPEDRQTYRPVQVQYASSTISAEMRVLNTQNWAYRQPSTNLCAMGSYICLLGWAPHPWVSMLPHTDPESHKYIMKCGLQPIIHKMPTVLFPPHMPTRSNAPSGPATVTCGCGGGAPLRPVIRAGRSPRAPPGAGRAAEPEAYPPHRRRRCFHWRAYNLYLCFTHPWQANGCE